MFLINLSEKCDRTKVTFPEHPQFLVVFIYLNL